MRTQRLRKRFAVIVAVYLITVLALWLIYQNTIFSYVRSNTTETAYVIEQNLVDKLDGEFSRMKLATSTLAGSVYVQDFLTETNKTAYYEKAGAVSEIIRKTTYPHMGEDIVLTLTSSGSPYRFTGGISDEAVRQLYSEIANSVAVYAVVTLDSTSYFCLVSSVYARDSENDNTIGYVVTLSNMAKVRRVLSDPETLSGIDTAVILDDVILFSSNPELDGQSAAELNRLYGSVTVSDVEGSDLYAAAAIKDDALYYGERLFFTVSGVTLAVLVVTVLILYRVLSAKVVSPTMARADTMQTGLLNTQIDAHFIYNTLSCIQSFAAQGKTEEIASITENLVAMLEKRSSTDAEIGVYDQMEDIQRYIDIMNIRYGDKFAALLEADDLYRYRMMGQILQPIVENAMTHGLGSKTEDCRLNVAGKLETDSIVFEVSDNGKGIEPAPLRALQELLDTADDWDSENYGGTGGGVALLNIQRRIRTKYGSGYGLTLLANNGGGLTVRVRLPVIPM